jgi:protein involved in polysaccharide export with SLBB domain
MKLKLFFMIFILFSIQSIFPQEGEGQKSFWSRRRNPLFEAQNKKYFTSTEQYYKTHSILRQNSPQVLEDTLDVMSYIVGPGDGFEIHIWSEFENEFFLNVNPQGTLVIPTVGEVCVNGLILKEANELIVDEIKKKYKTDNIAVNLVELRLFRVYLTGSVRKPGTYFVQSSDRISEVIEISDGVTYWADISNIEIRHKDDSIDKVDLKKFYLSGDKNENPYVKGGDNINVPDIDVDQGYIMFGNSGIFPYLPGEVLYDFLLRINAINSNSDLSNIMIIRDDKEIILNMLDEKEKVMSFPLQNNDTVIMPSVVDRVYVRGQVAIPGEYPFYANNTASQYIGRAGVPESASGDKSVYIIRYKDGEVVRGSHHIVEKGDTIVVPRRFKEDLKEYIAIIVPVASIALSTYAILKR